MAAGIRYSSAFTQFQNRDGTIAAGGTIQFYHTLTSTPQETYSDAALTIPNTNPITLNAYGRLPVAVFLDPDEGDYRIVFTDALGFILTDDPAGGNDAVDGIEAHNEDPDAHFTASETQRGMVLELANDTEAQEMTDTARVLTPSNLAALEATEDQLGLVRKANPGQTVTGTNDVRYLTPAMAQELQASSGEIATGTAETLFLGVKNFADNITNNIEGGLTLPGGLQFRWGTKTLADDDAIQTFTYADPFDTGTYHVFIQQRNENITSALPVSASTPPTVNGFSINRDDTMSGTFPFSYFAIGH